MSDEKMEVNKSLSEIDQEFLSTISARKRIFGRKTKGKPNISYCIFGDYKDEVINLDLNEMSAELVDQLITYDESPQDMTLYNLEVFADMYRLLSYMKDKKDLTYKLKRYIYKYYDWHRETLKFTVQKINEVNDVNRKIYVIFKSFKRNLYTNIQTDFSIPYSEGKSRDLKIKYKAHDMRKVEQIEKGSLDISIDAINLFYGKSLYSEFSTVQQKIKYMLEEESELSTYTVHQAVDNLYFYKGVTKIVIDGLEKQGLFNKTSIDELRATLLQLESCYNYYKDLIPTVDSITQQTKPTIKVLNCTKPRKVIDIEKTCVKDGIDMYLYAITATNDEGKAVYTDVSGYTTSPEKSEQELFNKIYNKWRTKEQIVPV